MGIRKRRGEAVRPWEARRRAINRHRQDDKKEWIAYGRMIVSCRAAQRHSSDKNTNCIQDAHVNRCVNELWLHTNFSRMSSRAEGSVQDGDEPGRRVVALEEEVERLRVGEGGEDMGVDVVGEGGGG